MKTGEVSENSRCDYQVLVRGEIALPDNEAGNIGYGVVCATFWQKYFVAGVFRIGSSHTA